MVMNSNELFSQRAEVLKKSKPQEKEDLFSQRAEVLKKVKQDQEEVVDPEIERHVARLASRGAEQIVGAPGNIRDLAYATKDALTSLKEKSAKNFGFPLPKEPESFKKFDEAIPIAKTVSGLLDYLPTSSKLKEKSQELTGGYTSPKTESERIGDELFENLVASALPGQGKANLWRNIAAPTIGVLGKEFVKQVGGSEKSQALTQIGLNLAIPLMSANAKGYNNKLWSEVEKSAPTLSVNIANQRKEAQYLLKNIETNRLGSTGEKKVSEILKDFLYKTSNGTMTGNQLVGFNKSLNNTRGDPALLTGGYTLLNDVSDIIKKSAKEFKKIAPDFYQQWKNANEVHGAIANSAYIANGIRKMSKPLVSDGARALFGAATHAGAGVLASVPPLFAIYKGTQILNRVAQSPVLMKYYTNILKSSLRGNTVQMASSLEKLDNALLKEEQKAKPPFKNNPRAPQQTPSTSKQSPKSLQKQ